MTLLHGQGATPSKDCSYATLSLSLLLARRIRKVGVGVSAGDAAAWLARVC